MIDHTSSTAEIKFVSTINQGSNDESWGISDVYVEYLSDNGSCESTPEPGPNDNCIIGEGFWSGNFKPSDFA